MIMVLIMVSIVMMIIIAMAGLMKIGEMNVAGCMASICNTYEHRQNNSNLSKVNQDQNVIVWGNCDLLIKKN